MEYRVHTEDRYYPKRLFNFKQLKEAWDNSETGKDSLDEFLDKCDRENYDDKNLKPEFTLAVTPDILTFLKDFHFFYDEEGDFIDYWKGTYSLDGFTWFKVKKVKK